MRASKIINLSCGVIKVLSLITGLLAFMNWLPSNFKLISLVAFGFASIMGQFAHQLVYAIHSFNNKVFNKNKN